MQSQLLFFMYNTKTDSLSHGHFMTAVVYNILEENSLQRCWLTCYG